MLNATHQLSQIITRRVLQRTKVIVGPKGRAKWGYASILRFFESDLFSVFDPIHPMGFAWIARVDLDVKGFKNFVRSTVRIEKLIRLGQVSRLHEFLS